MHAFYVTYRISGDQVAYAKVLNGPQMSLNEKNHWSDSLKHAQGSPTSTSMNINNLNSDYFNCELTFPARDAQNSLKAASKNVSMATGQFQLDLNKPQEPNSNGKSSPKSQKIYFRSLMNFSRKT